MALLLENIPTVEWVPRQSIVFDWFNGPKHGICELQYPTWEFEFTCIAERLNPDGVDHRLYSVAELDEGTVDQVRELLTDLGTPLAPVWVPVWNFSSLDERQKVEGAIDNLLRLRKSTNLVIYTLNMTSILECWRVDPIPQKVDSLFDLLGITNK